MRTPLGLSLVFLTFMPLLNASLTFADNRTYSPPTLDGKRIDRCVKDGAKNNCDTRARGIAANAFCRAKGDEKALIVSVDDRNKFPKAVKRALQTLSGIKFVDAVGIHTFTRITCESTLETRRFFRPVQNGMRIDRCVQGAGWGFTDPYRCDGLRRRQIAKKFCLDRGYRDQQATEMERHMGNHAILTFRRGDSYRNGVWTQVSGGDAFRIIVCVR